MAAGIKIDSKATIEMLKKVAKQLPFAAATALNETARKAAADVNAAMPQTFAHTNAFTRQAVGALDLATKSDLSATVGIKPLQAQYLGLEIYGGERTPTSTALVLPGHGPDPLPRGFVKRLAAQAAADQARRQAVAAGTRKRGKLTGSNTGVFRLSGHGIRPGDQGGFFRRLPNHRITRLIAFEPSAEYQPKFDFEAQVRKSVDTNLTSNFQKRLAKALATAR